MGVEASPQLLRVTLTKPAFFDDIRVGDSICCNGVCLTVEKFDDSKLIFALAAETLRVLGMQNLDPKKLVGQSWNLERSLKFGDRIHGHLVTGHVESLGEITESRQDGESLWMKIKVSQGLRPYLWTKGSVTLHGVSLTVNEIHQNEIQVCLIPETQKRTNLSQLRVGDRIHVEPDYMAKAIVRSQELQREEINRLEVQPKGESR